MTTAPAATVMSWATHRAVVVMHHCVVLACLLGLASTTVTAAARLPGIVATPSTLTMARDGLIMAALFAVVAPAVVVLVRLSYPVRAERPGWGSVLVGPVQRLGLTGSRPSVWGRRVWYGLIGWAAAYLSATLITKLVAPIPVDPRYVQTSAASGGMRFLHGVLGAAPVEEVAFRGTLLLVVAGCAAVLPSRLARAAAIAALVASSVLFGLAHLSFGWSNVATATAGGLIFGGIALRTRSIIPPMIAHALYNGTVYWLSAA